jgi:Fur family ferric uptake transcriptional regulator
MNKEESNQIARQLLSQSSGRSTTARINVLSILLSAPAALNHQGIEEVAKAQGLSFDRVTLYRALDWLVEKDLVHRIASTNRSWYFNAISESGTQSHAHFHCNLCSQIYCLEDVQTTPIKNLPSHYQVEETELNLQGQCVSCSQQ